MKVFILLSILFVVFTCSTLIGQGGTSETGPGAVGNPSAPRSGPEVRTYPSGLELIKAKDITALDQYLFEVLAAIRSKWYPQIPKLQKTVGRNPGTAVIEFEVKNDGSLRDTRKIESAGNASLDAAAMEAISTAAPFENFPKAYTGKSFKLRMHFGYDQPASSEAPFCDGPDLGAHPGNSTVYRVGKGVVAPRAIYQPDPEYSEEARKAKHISLVRIAGTVDSQGAFTDLCVAEAAGKGLDEQTIRAASTWKFEPGTLQGKPVPVRLVVEETFMLY